MTTNATLLIGNGMPRTLIEDSSCARADQFDFIVFGDDLTAPPTILLSSVGLAHATRYLHQPRLGNDKQHQAHAGCASPASNRAAKRLPLTASRAYDKW